MTVDLSAVARVVGITTDYVDMRGGAAFLPQRIAVFAQGNSDKTYASTKYTATNHRDVGARFGWGSPAHLIARELHPDNGDGVGSIPVTYYPMQDGYEAIAGVGRITPAGTQTKTAAYRMRIGGVKSEPFVVPADATVAERCDLIVAAVNAVLHMPVIASDQTTRVDFTAKWAGLSSNGIKVEILGDLYGGTFATVDTVNGLVNPDVTDVLPLMGGVWETMGLNALNFDDDDALDAFQEFGEGRWLPTVRRPLVVFRGCTSPTYQAAIAPTSTRTDDRVNCQLVSPGSVNLPFVVAARQLARIVKVANDNPARDYGSQRATGLLPGDDSVQWDWATRDAAVKGGSSTIEIKDGVVNVSDVVTSWAPEGEAPPAYRHVCDIVKLQQVIFNLDLKFATDDWDGAPFIPDDQPTVNPSAKKPKMWIAEANGVLDGLGLEAVLADVAAAKKKTFCRPNSQNPKRYDAGVVVQVGGNANVADIALNWGFFYPAPTVVG